VRNNKLQKIRTPAYTGFEDIDEKFVMREPFHVIRILVCGAGIHFTFTSLTLAFGLRRVVATD
jgi:hypothetical protein